MRFGTKKLGEDRSTQLAIEPLKPQRLFAVDPGHNLASFKSSFVSDTEKILGFSVRQYRYWNWTAV